MDGYGAVRDRGGVPLDAGGKIPYRYIVVLYRYGRALNRYIVTLYRYRRALDRCREAMDPSRMGKPRYGESPDRGCGSRPPDGLWEVVPDVAVPGNQKASGSPR